MTVMEARVAQCQVSDCSILGRRKNAKVIHTDFAFQMRMNVNIDLVMSLLTAPILWEVSIVRAFLDMKEMVLIAKVRNGEEFSQYIS